MKEKVVYYKDELNDDFANENFEEKDISNYKYINDGKIYNIVTNIIFKIIIIPIAYIYSKVTFNVKFKNKKILRKYKNQSYYIYGNHTQPVIDALAPAISNKKKPYVIVSSKNLQIPVIGKIIPMLGGIPIHQDKATGIKFLKAIKYYEEKGHPIVIYPEAHVWPYYTKIRNFSDISFRYPIKDKLPVFSYTTTYQKRRFCRKPKITIWIDGPFFSEEGLNIKEAQKNLRDKVYNQMNKRAKLNTVEYIKYIKHSD